MQKIIPQCVLCCLICLSFIFSLIKAIAQPTLDTDLAPVFAGEGSLTAELTSLRLKGVPQELNNKHFLRDYYSQFGSVKRIYSHPASDSAVVTFFEHVGYF